VLSPARRRGSGSARGHRPRRAGSGTDHGLAGSRTPVLQTPALFFLGEVEITLHLLQDSAQTLVHRIARHPATLALGLLDTCLDAFAKIDFAAAQSLDSSIESRVFECCKLSHRISLGLSSTSWPGENVEAAVALHKRPA